MKTNYRQHGFSLTEVLLAIATLAIGMLFVGGTFALGIHYSTRATEKAVAGVIAEEAFTKIRLYGLGDGDPNVSGYEPFNLPIGREFEYAYPSDRETVPKQYFWAAVVKIDADTGLVQATVFVMRHSEHLVPEKVQQEDLVTQVMDGAYVVNESQTGRVLQVTFEPDMQQQTSMEAFFDPNDQVAEVWALPSPDGRNPCIAIYQALIKI
jgi:prepilin-type N-terminal cleavage/methylation domain-containing protein